MPQACLGKPFVGGAVSELAAAGVGAQAAMQCWRSAAPCKTRLLAAATWLLGGGEVKENYPATHQCV